MSSQGPEPATRSYTAMDRAPHTLHECRDAQEFRLRFESATGSSVEQAIDPIVAAGTPKAVFLTGSLPLGMATSGSDVDLVVLVDERATVRALEGVSTNNERRLIFSNESDPLRAGEFLSVINGILVDMAVIITPSIASIYHRLRSRGPELSESEILTLGRLRTGWLLWQSDGYLARHHLTLTDPVFDVYCCTRSYVSALHLLQKARKALESMDIPLTLHLGRSSVEAAYLAYFAGEGLSYLGPKWLAQIGHARDAADRVSRHRLLEEGIPSLFPTLTANADEAAEYLRTVSTLLISLRRLIEDKTMFRIAFRACPQIHSL
jgi:Nucleotidyltransferase domain